jgi:hypothetical protein
LTIGHDDAIGPSLAGSEWTAMRIRGWWLPRKWARNFDLYHGERNHQGLENELIEGAPAVEEHIGRIRRRQRLGGLLNYYCRAA